MSNFYALTLNVHIFRLDNEATCDTTLQSKWLPLLSVAPQSDSTRYATGLFSATLLPVPTKLQTGN